MVRSAKAHTSTVEVTALTHRASPRFPALRLRRLLAWSLETAFIVSGACVPLALSHLMPPQLSEKTAVESPLIRRLQTASRWLLLQPRPNSIAPVPVTDLLLETLAVLAPVAIASGQIYQLSRSGQTWPKRWLNLRVTTPMGQSPSWQQAAQRELIGRWGVAFLVAYGIWRWSGLFPNLRYLLGLTLMALLGEGGLAYFSLQERALHDSLAGTQVLDRRTLVPALPAAQPPPRLYGQNVGTAYSLVRQEESGLTSVVFSSPLAPQVELVEQVRRSPLLSFSILILGGLVLLVSVAVGSQVRWPSKTGETAERRDPLFANLVETLIALPSDRLAQRQTTILAIANSQDSRRFAFLADLLAESNNPALVETIQQGLVSIGPEVLPHLHRLNLSLDNDLAALRDSAQYPTILKKQQAVKRAIAKILVLYSGELNQANLSQVNLERVEGEVGSFQLVLNRVQLAGSQWSGARLNGANLRFSYFFAAGRDRKPGTYDDWTTDLSGADLTAADLTQADLRWSKLEQVSLFKAILPGAQLDQANLTAANLSEAQLINASLRQAKLNQASLTGADLTEANLQGAQLQDGRLRRVQAAGAVLARADLTRSGWQEANLSDANLQNANLAWGDFSGANLTGADLSGTDLQNANLQAANLTGVSLAKADLAGANFAGTLLSAQPVGNQSGFINQLPSEEESGSQLAGVDFSQARNLSREQLIFICTQGGLHPACR
ncbi:pentapeptide repeat-containing protein [Sphaerothrix gracilis]|uniref:pentapeptide repeat-containing protein n=1 Tax=Sphaerothrix gracilis TaxID=3151835 RepID=UPI0031FBB35F